MDGAADAITDVMDCNDWTSSGASAYVGTVDASAHPFAAAKHTCGNLLHVFCVRPLL